MSTLRLYERGQLFSVRQSNFLMQLFLKRIGYVARTVIINLVHTEIVQLRNTRSGVTSKSEKLIKYA